MHMFFQELTAKDGQTLGKSLSKTWSSFWRGIRYSFFRITGNDFWHRNFHTKNDFSLKLWQFVGNVNRKNSLLLDSQRQLFSRKTKPIEEKNEELQHSASRS